MRWSVSFKTYQLIMLSLYLIFSPLQMQNISFCKDFMFKLKFGHHPPLITDFGFVACSRSEYWKSPFLMVSSFGLVKGSKGESVYSPVMSAHDITWVHSSAGSLGRYLGEITQALEEAGWLSLHQATRSARQALPQKPFTGSSFQRCQIAERSPFFEPPVAFSNYPKWEYDLKLKLFSFLINCVPWLKRHTVFHNVIGFEVPKEMKRPCGHWTCSSMLTWCKYLAQDKMTCCELKAH